jgi:hypothetical protein
MWALRTADDWCLYDGAAFLLPGYIAASLTPDELAGCEPALRAVFDTVLHQRQTPQATRLQVTELYGRTLGRSPVGDSVAATCGDQAHKAAELRRLQAGERVDQLWASG